MKDSEFIELLNLYLDHEISPADAVRLEAEVQSNAARRRIYQDYCRMQKACKVLAHDFQTEPSTAADKKVVPFSPATVGRASRGNAFYTVGALAAAAACLAIIFVGRSRQQEETEVPGVQAVAKTEPAVAPVAKTVAIDTPQAQVRATRTAPGIRRADQSVQTPFASNTMFFGSKPSAVPVAATTTHSADDQFRWLTGEINLVSLDQQQVGFQVPPMTVQSEGQQLGGSRAPQKSQAPATEMVTFKYTLGR